MSTTGSSKTAQDVLALFLDGRVDGAPGNPRPLSPKQTKWLDALCSGEPTGVSCWQPTMNDRIAVGYTIFWDGGDPVTFRVFKSGRGELERIIP
jgi:hypothetical protein